MADNPVDVRVGRRLADARRSRSRSAADLAASTGVIEPVINLYEAGLRRVSAEALWRLCGALGIQPSVLFKDEHF